MKILITGGAGFIGSFLVEIFLLKNFKIVVIDNYTTGNPNNLPENENLKIIEGDISDEILIKNCFVNFKPDFVIHCAASYNDPDNWERDIKTNIKGTANIVKASVDNNIKRLIYFQTALCYGLKPKIQPIPIDYPRYPANSSYAITKTAGEEYIEMSGLDFISFRLANIIGPRNLSGPVAAFFHRLSNNKETFVMNTRRDFVYVKDVVNIVEKAINFVGNKGFYHISTGTDVSIKEVYDETVKSLKLKILNEIEIREKNPDDAFSILLDPSKTIKDFNYIVETPLSKSVSEAVKWYQKNGVINTYSHLKKTKDGNLR